MTITTNDARDEYTSGPGQTVFNYTFKIFASDELDVYVTPAGQEANDSTDLTTDYVVDSGTIGNEAGGFITFNTPLSSGDKVTIASGIPYDRTTDYQFNGDFNPTTVNNDNDRQTAQIKQVLELARKAVVFGQAQQGTSGLTSEAPEAGKFIRWKSDLAGFENVSLQEISDGVVAVEDLIIVFDTVADMIGDTSGIITVGQTIRTRGYTEAGDGGDNLYEIVAAGTGTDDGGSFIDLSTHQAKGLFLGDVVNVRQYGAVGDGTTDDTAAFQAAEAAESRFNVPGGLYNISYAPDVTKMWGEGVISIGGDQSSLAKSPDFFDQLGTSIDRFLAGDSPRLDVDKSKSEIVIELNGSDTGTDYDWSLRESSMVWYPSTKTWYLIVDAVPFAPAWTPSTAYSLNDVVNNDGNMYVCTTAGTSAGSGGPTGTGTGIADGTAVWDFVLVYEHPNSLNTEIHLFKSTTVESMDSWSYVGVAIPKGGVGQLGEFGVGSPASAVVINDEINCAFSARNTASFTERSIGLAYSSSDPDVVPWTKLSDPISDTPGEDDDPCLVLVDGDPRVHLYHRTTDDGTGSGSVIVHRSSPTPKQSNSWAPTNIAVPRFDGTVSAVESTAAFVLNGVVHIFVIEQAPSSVTSHWISGNPDSQFVPSNIESRFLTDIEVFGGLSSLAFSGHFTPAVRDGELRGIFWTKNNNAPRYTTKGNITANAFRQDLPRSLGLFKASPNATQSIPDSVVTKVGFLDTITNTYDNDNWFISSRYTPQQEGWYQFEAFVQLTAMVDGSQVILEIQKNGTRFSHLGMEHASNTSAIGVGGASPPILMNGTTDYVEIFIFQNSGVAQNVSGSSNSSYFSGRFIGV